MLDSDLAASYGVATKTVTQAVKRNLPRFPEDFVFRLTAEQWRALRSQIVTSRRGERRGGRRYPPVAFTEQGVAMLSSVLRSEGAVRVNIEVAPRSRWTPHWPVLSRCQSRWTPHWPVLGVHRGRCRNWPVFAAMKGHEV